MDRAKLLSGWTKMKSGSVMTKYKQQSPGEMAALDNYINAIAAGVTPAEPTLSTAFGSGLADMINAGFPKDTIPVPGTIKTAKVSDTL